MNEETFTSTAYASTGHRWRSYWRGVGVENEKKCISKGMHTAFYTMAEI